MPASSSRSNAIAAISAAIAACGVARRAGAQAAKVVRIGAPSSEPFATPFFIKDAGTFARIGYDVDTLHMNNGAAVIAAVTGGSLDIGVSDVIPVMNAINKGLPIALIAGCGLYLSSEANIFLGVLADSPIRQARDLEGKSVSVSNLSGISAAALRAWLIDNGVDLAKVKLVEAPGQAQPAMISRGVVDAGFLGPPFYTPRSMPELRILTRPFDAIAKEFLVSAWFATRTWIDADRERAKSVVAAAHATSQWANTHRPEAGALLARDLKLDLEVVRNMQRTTFATSLNPAHVTPIIALADRFKLTDKPISVNTLIARV